MAKILNLNTLKDEHSDIHDNYEDFCREVVRQIHQIIKDANITPAVPIQLRVKGWGSILDKIEQKRFTIKKSITELQDLAGIRIILLFSRDMQKIRELIKSNFKILREYNSEDKLNDDQFGYSSTHLVVTLINEWLKTPTLSKFKDIKVEIQLRTLSQHSWAEVSQTLQYKQEDNVPKPLKRSISRVSALLEMVDLEYERLLSERDIYKNDLKEKSIQQGDTELNVDLLEEILDTYLPPNNKNAKEDYSDLLGNLQVLDFSTTSKLTQLITDNIKYAIDFDKKVAFDMYENYKKTKDFSSPKYNYSGNRNSLSSIKKGSFLAHSGLIRLILNKVLGKPWNEAILSKKIKNKSK